MTAAGVTALRACAWALLACGWVGFFVGITSVAKWFGVASALGGIVCWATFTTAAAFVEYVSAKLESINKNTKRMADALEQGLR